MNKYGYTQKELDEKYEEFIENIINDMVKYRRLGWFGKMLLRFKYKILRWFEG